MKIDYCIHTHTRRCGHARGEDEEYVLNAIKAGIKTLGFSDHVFLPETPQPGIRGYYFDLKDYIESVSYLKEKYKDQIKIYLGFECEYFDEYLDYYKSLLKDYKFDYLILGQHFFMDKDGSLFYVRNSIEDDNVERYFREVEKAMKSGIFTYFAHPDLVLTLFNTFDEEAEKVSRRLCEMAKKYDIPLEVNLNGMTWTIPTRLSYPCEEFWRVVGEVGNKVVIGYDAHWPEFFQETKYMEKALDFVKKYNLNLIDPTKLIE